MKKKILEKINDLYNLKKFAPYGLEFIMASDIASYSEKFKSQKQHFLNNINMNLRDLNQDYVAAYAESIPLSKKPVQFNDSLSEALFQRESARDLVKSDCDLDQLSFLLKLSCGLKNKSDIKSKRMFPSGGGLYSTRVYIDIRKVKNISEGLYLFNPYKETLDLVNDEITDQQRLKLRNNSVDFTELENTSFQVLLSIKPQISVSKYGEHGIKLAFMEIGHLAQNILLVSTACGLQSYPNSALSLKATKNFLRTDPTGEFLVYSIVFS